MHPHRMGRELVQRLEGGYKDDSIIDGIAYAANLAEEMQTATRPIPAEPPCEHDVARIGDNEEKMCVKCGAAFA